MSFFVDYLPPPPVPPAPTPTVPLDYGSPELLTFRAAIKRLSPPWLQKGRAGRYMYALGKLLDDQTALYVAGFKSRHPGLYSFDSLALVGRDRKIRRGRVEVDAHYAERLAHFLDDHSTRGGPYAMLAQLFQFYAPANFEIDLVYRSGRRFQMDEDGVVVRDDIGHFQAAKWAQWTLYFEWPDAVALDGTWGSGGTWDNVGVWGSDLTPTEVSDLRLVPREWNAAHAIGKIVLLTAGVKLWGYPTGTWGDGDLWGGQDAVQLSVGL